MSGQGIFAGLQFQLRGRMPTSHAQLTELIESNGGTVSKSTGLLHEDMTELNYLVCGGLRGNELAMQEAVTQYGVNVVTDRWVLDSVQAQVLLTDPSLYLIPLSLPKQSSSSIVASNSAFLLEGLKFALVGKLSQAQSELQRLIKQFGGQTVAKLSAKVTHVLCNLIPAPREAELVDFRSHNEGVFVKEEWLHASVSSGCLQDCASNFLTEWPSTASVADHSGKPLSVLPSSPQIKSNKKQKPDTPAASKVITVNVTNASQWIIPVDTECSSSTRDVTSVYVDESSNTIYDAALNQTCIGHNNNKFYIIQLLVNGDRGEYSVYCRWGRVGARGQNSTDSFGTDLASAIRAFERKFRDKTRTHWSERKRTTINSGTYVFLEKQYDKMPAIGIRSPAMKPAAECKLDTRTQNLIKLICNVSMMRRQAVQLGLNVEQLPLGKLSKDHIKRAYTILGSIGQAITNNADRSELELLSNHFYTLIPHVNGMSALPVIATHAAVNDKMELIITLDDIQAAAEVMEQTEAPDVMHPVDEQYCRLQCGIKPMDPTDDAWGWIQAYVDKTHNQFSGRAYTVKVDDIYELDRVGEHDRFVSYRDDSNRQLLWHSSRLGNFAGILSQGLRICPPTAPVSGFRLDRGLYFTETLAKSSSYCYADRYNNKVCMLLCEVALGQSQLRYADDQHASRLDAGTSSTWGVGNVQPDLSEHLMLPDKLRIPMGRLVKREGPPSAFEYDEKVVYDTARIKMKYLVQATFLF